MIKQFTRLLLLSTIISGCSLAPNFKLPELHLPEAYKEQPTAKAEEEEKGHWKKAETLEKEDRGQWWKIFGDEQLNQLEKDAADANQSLKVAAARVQEARATADANSFSFLPDLSLGANAVRSQPANAALAAFGQTTTAPLKPYTLYAGQGVLSYEADLFGRVRDSYKAYLFEADAESATYRSALLALQADVAQNYFAIRALDSERQLLRDTVDIREKAARIMQRKFDVGAAGEQDLTRTMSELSGSKADLVALDRQRSTIEHALAVLLGKMPAEFTMAPSPLVGAPPEIPAGLPSTLLERRPDIANAQAAMEAANARIGVARSAFFPSIDLTASGGYESTQLSQLFKWPNRTWALGQLAGTAITMPIFDSGRNMAHLDAAHSAYDEAVATYRQQVLTGFRDVEDSLANQRLLAEQSIHQDAAAAASARTTEVIAMRYDEGDIDFFQVVDAERDSLASGRAAVQVRGQRFLTTIALVRALGGSWDEPAIEKPKEPQAPAAEAPVEAPAETPTDSFLETPAPAAQPQPPAPVTPVIPPPIDTSPKLAPESSSPRRSPTFSTPLTNSDNII